MTWFSFANWLKRAHRQATAFPRTIRPNKRSQSLRSRHRLEELECRNLPSTITVLNNADSGSGSLRDTIAAAQNGDTIIFDSSLEGQTITLTSGELALNQNLDIEGPGPDQLAISGNDASRVFRVGSGVSVAIDDLTITHGRAPGPRRPGQPGPVGRRLQPERHPDRRSQFVPRQRGHGRPSARCDQHPGSRRRPGQRPRRDHNG
jgi:hypothetical protein